MLVVVGVFVFFGGVLIGSTQGDLIGCLYGNCKKDGFSIRETNTIIWTGTSKFKGNFSTLARGFVYHKDNGDFTFLSNENKGNIIMIKGDEFAVGKMKGNLNDYCISKGLSFKMDLSSYQEINNPDCK